MSRLALLAPGEGWVEGIRVDPAVRGREVATNLQVAELAWAAAHEVRVVRYTTGQDNEASHRLGARHGFLRQADRRSYGPRRDTGSDEMPPPDASALRRLDVDAPAAEVERWWRLVADDPTFTAGDRLYEPRGWAFQALDADRFAAHVRRGEVALARDGGALVCPIRRTWPATATRTRRTSPCCGRDGRSALALLDDLRRAAGAPRVRLADPLPRFAGPVAEAAGGGLRAPPGQPTCWRATSPREPPLVARPAWTPTLPEPPGR